MLPSTLDKLQNPEQKITIALDGPSASGKGHIGQEISRLYHLEYVESSYVYRKLGYMCLKQDIAANDIPAILKIAKEITSNESNEKIELGGEKIGSMTSEISAILEVREILTNYLSNKIKNTARIIMEGRDIGSVVAPEADLKIFITADLEIRAKRRYNQLRQMGKDCMLSDILESLRERDERDMNRSCAPLKASADAIIIDTSTLTPEQVIEEIIVHCK